MDLSVALIAAGSALDGSAVGPLVPQWRFSLGLGAAKIVERLKATRTRKTEPTDDTPTLF